MNATSLHHHHHHHYHHLLPSKPPPPFTKLTSLKTTPPSSSSSSLTANPPPAAPLTEEKPTRHRPTATTTDDTEYTAFWDYQHLFMSQRSEAVEPVVLRVVEGAVPRDFPSGTYYLAGPGLFSDDHGSTVHPLDGHGYLRSFSIDGGAGEVRFKARYVETEAQAEERDAETGRWRFTHRGPFSVLKGGRRVGNVKVMKNVANTSVLCWGGRLLCMWEGGDPYEIDPRSLATRGRFDIIPGDADEATSSGPPFHGWLDAVDVAALFLKPVLHGVFKMPEKRILSHYKIDEKRGRLLIMSCRAEDMLLPRSNFTFYELDSDFKLLQKRDFTIPDHLMIHDWAFTDNHYILVGNRIKLDIPGYDWKSGKLDPAFMNAVKGEESLLPHLFQISIKMDKKGKCQDCSITASEQWKKPSDFPAINPSFSGTKNSHIYVATTSRFRKHLPHFPFDSVVKLDSNLDKPVAIWSAGYRQFIGEPVFVPKGVEEDDGYVLVVEYAISVQRCYLVILDARRIGRDDAVVAKLEVPKHLNFPLGFHGFWAANN
ncbi:hypothetical protein QJS04_geneDACA018446 [Acorus gramineus]|uniref:Carotenoid cleavage dioxygenase 7 n=1 Tax=Acorus gramineus TaxID=55184 RepID=A0AAV9AB43_ACOGR|nr:hypothetical protein QJS04_geneDACA018446 [Acorus gramineus]